MSPDKKENYQRLHRKFNDSYASTGSHVMEFYPAWKNFMEANGPEIGRYVNNFSSAEADEKLTHGLERLFYFLKDFREYALSANKIMAEYNQLCSQSNAYLDKVLSLQQKNDTTINRDDLIPELNGMINGFKEIEEKTRKAAINLKLIQVEWAKIRERIKGP